MAKKINDIIRESVEYILTEQKKGAKLNPFSPTNPDSLKADRVFYKSNNVIPWPVDIPKKLYPAKIEKMFKDIGAKPFTYGINPDLSKNKIPQMYFPYAEETFRFQPDGTVYARKSNLQMYWKYIDRPFYIQINKSTPGHGMYAQTLTAGKSPNINKDTININEQIVPMPILSHPELGPSSQARDATYIHYSKPGTGKIEVSKTKDGEPEFTIYISKSGQPTIMYKKQAAEIAADTRWEKNKAGIRGVMDIIGFVPFIGDAFDIVQASWYFYDFLKKGQWSDLGWCLLSLIAAFPVFGSFVKAGMKGIVNTLFSGPFTKNATVKLIAKIREILQKHVADGDLTESQLEAVSKGAQVVFGRFIKWSSSLKRKLKLSPEQLTRWNDLEQAVLELSMKIPKQIDEILAATRASKYGINLAAGTVSPTTMDKFTSLIIRGGAKSSRAEAEQVKGFWNTLKSAFGKTKKILAVFAKWSVRPKMAAEVYANIQKAFIQEIENTLRSTTSNNFALKLIATATPALRKELYKKLKFYAKPSYDAAGRAFPDLSTLTSLTRWNQLLTRTPESSLQNLAKGIGEICMNGGHSVWGMILSDPNRQLIALLPTSGKQAFKMLWQNIGAARKLLRMVVMGLHDAAYDIGFEFADSDEQSILYQAFKDALIGEDSKKGDASGSEWLTNINKWLPNNRNTSGTFTIPGYDRPDQWIDPASLTKIKTKTTTPKAKAKVTPEPKTTVTPKVTPEPKTTVTPKVTPEPKTTVTPKAKTKTKEKEEDEEVNYYDADGNIDASKLSL
jgi:hypothetical protein